MKRHIVIGLSLLLTLGTAVAGSFIYGHEGSDAGLQGSMGAVPEEREPTPELIAMWKATAVSADYSAPKLPI